MDVDDGGWWDFDLHGGLFDLGEIGDVPTS